MTTVTNTSGTYTETTIANKQVACKPLKVTKTKSGFDTWDSKQSLVELEVVFSDRENEYEAKSKVYVRPFLETPGWLKEVFTLNGEDVVFVPKDFIVAASCEKHVLSLPWFNPPKYPWDLIGGPYGGDSTDPYSATWGSGVGVSVTK